ncbi:MAG: protein-L-isoaspartate(D-aspartate) O-methyltransferase [Rhodospirillales bacterium]
MVTSGFAKWARVGAAAVLPVLAVAPAAAGDAAPLPGGDGYAAPRREMVRVIEEIAAYAPLSPGRRALSPGVLKVMAEVPRHAFVPQALRDSAYDDRPLPIGYGQTISQPYIVALMTDLLEVDGDDVVLEVGTGSGYQAAVLARIVKHVYTMEIVPPLADRARGRLAAAGYANVTVRTGDGYYGWPAHGPFDGIVVTAAASHIPPPLVAQLRPGARMVIPVGAAFLVQHLVLVEKDLDGTVTTRLMLPVAFVPLTGGH